jgi:hypothetical protein
MNVTRRKFLRAGTVSALLAGFGLKPPQLVFGQSVTDAYGGYAVPYEAQTNPVYYFNQETFQPYVGTEFVVEGGRLLDLKSMRLTGITDWQARLRAGRLRTHRGECFSLHFQSGSRALAPPRTYWLGHASLGKFQLFITGQTAAGGCVYEAVINHLA